MRLPNHAFRLSPPLSVERIPRRRTILVSTALAVTITLATGSALAMGPPPDDAGSLAVLGDAGPAIWPVGSSQPLEIFDAAAGAAALAVDAERGILWVVGQDAVSAHGADDTGESAVELFRSDLDLPDDAEPPTDEAPRHVAVVPGDGPVWIAAGRHLWTVGVEGRAAYRGERDAEIVGLAIDARSEVLWLADAESVESFDLGADDPLAAASSSLKLPAPFPTSENPDPDPAATVEPTALLFEPGTWEGDTQTEAARVWVGAGERLLRYVLPFEGDPEDAAPSLDLDLETLVETPVERLVTDGESGVWLIGGSRLGHWRGRSQRLSFQVPFRPRETELTALAYDPGNRAVWVAGGDRLVRVGLSGWALGRRHQLSAPVSDLAVVSTFVDDIPPQLEITRPRPHEEQPAGRPELRFAYSDETSGVDEGSLEIALDGESLDARCSYRPDGATCRPEAELAEGEYQLTATVGDAMGNRSEVATARLALLEPGSPGDPGAPDTGSGYTPVSSPRGFRPNQPFRFGEIDTIDTASGNVTIRIPLGQTYEVGPMIRYQLMAVNNSNAWDYVKIPCKAEYEPCESDRPTTFAMPNAGSNAGLGWEVHFGKLFASEPPPELDDTNSERWPTADQDSEEQRKMWLYVAPDGARTTLHALPDRDNGTLSRPVRYSKDGSFVRMRQVSATEARVEFPDGRYSVFERHDSAVGTDFCGNGVTGCWRFEEMKDRYGNSMDVTYSAATGTETWTVGDSTGREHTLRFATNNWSTAGGDGNGGDFTTHDGDQWGDLRRLLDWVDVAAFGGETARYDFTYLDHVAIGRSCPPNADPLLVGDKMIKTRVLKSISVPHSRKYVFTTDTSDSTGCGRETRGKVTGVVLPTRAEISYGYGGWPTPTRCDYSRDPDDAAETHYTAVGLGTKTRFRPDPEDPAGPLVEEGSWSYSTALIPAPSGLDGGGADCERSKVRKTTVDGPTNTDGNHVRTVSYHSIWEGPRIPTPAEPGTDWQVTDHGLPFTKNHSVGGSDLGKLFLSSRTFLCTASGCGNAQRSTYRRYVSEFRMCNRLAGPGDSPGCFQVNPLILAERTVFHDDTFEVEDTTTPEEDYVTVERFVERRSLEPDGAGHFRTRRKKDNFAGAHQRKTVTDYTVTGEILSIDTATGYVDPGDPSSYLPKRDKSWILTPFDETKVTENGRTYVEETRFDDKGSPWCRRTWKNAGGRSKKDRVVLLDLGKNIGKDAGLPTKEIVMGGDYGELAIGLPCTDPAKSPEENGRKYVFDHAYVDLQLASTRIGTFPYRYRADIDQNTGLPKKVYEPTDEARTLTFDQLGRLTKIDPDSSLDEADTVYIYANPADADPTMTMRRRNLSDQTLLEEVTVFDHFGRTTEEKHTMPNPNSQSGSFVSLRKTTYDDAGHVTSRTTLQREGHVDGSDARRFSNFDAFGRPRTITEADGSVETRSHLGERSTTSTVKVQTRDGLADRSVTTLRDAQGRVVSTATSEHTTTFAYDPHGRQVSARRQVGGVTQTRAWGYDARGYLTSVGLPEVTGNGGEITYRVDALGLAREVRDGAHELTWNYDGDGRPSSVTEDLGNNTVRTWKSWGYGTINDTSGLGTSREKGRLIRAERYNYLPNRQPLRVREDYEYREGSGGISQLDRSVFRGGSEIVKFRTKFAYDLLGNPDRLTYPSCHSGACNDGNDQPARGHTATWSYNQGFMRQVSSSLGPSASFNYAVNGQLKETLFSNGVTGTYERDPHSLVRPRRRTFTGPGGTLFDTGVYKYDGAGNIQSIGVERYTYDGAGRLRRGTVNHAESGRYEEYTYDAADNLVNIHNDSFGEGGTPADRPFAIDPQTNRILGVGPEETFTYDGAGNTLQALRVPGEPDPDDPDLPHYEWEWDVFNMQTAARRNLEGGGSEHWVYVYGPGDYRLWTEDYSGDEVVSDWKFRGPNGQIVQEYEVLDDLATWNHVRDVIHGAEGPMAARYADGSERYFHTDHLGTPRVITKADGTKLSEHHYYPYGLEVLIEQEDPVPEGFLFADGFETGDTSRWATPGSPQPPPEGPPPEELAVKYTGHERDLHRTTDYMLARSYAFLLGRFLSVDRVQDGWNRYGYARNNPIVFIDPDGQRVEISTAGREKQLRKFLVRALKRKSFRESFAKLAEDPNFTVTISDARLNSTAKLRLDSQRDGVIEPTFGLAAPKVQITVGDDGRGIVTITGASVRIDTTIVVTFHPDSSGVTTVAHEIAGHVIDYFNQLSTEDTEGRHKEVERLGRDISRESPDLTDEEARALLDELLSAHREE